MKLQELDVIRLADGREGTIVNIQDDRRGRVFLIELDGVEFFGWPYVREADIAAVVWHAADKTAPPRTKTVLSA